MKKLEPIADIDELLTRYYDGDTTLDEERQLKDYLARYPGSADKASAALFADLRPALSSPGSTGARRRWAFRTAAAAVLVALVLLLRQLQLVSEPAAPRSELTARLLLDQPLYGDIRDQAIALEQARRALSFVSAQLNKGTRELEHLDRLGTSVDKIKNESL